MKKQHLLVLFSLMVIGLVVGIFQYVKVFQAEIVGAYNATKSANGHSWAEMQCTEGLCVTAGNKVGIGTDNPADKLSVAGSFGVNGNISTSGTITATGDVCGAGACLSSIASFVSAQPLMGGNHNQGACTAAGGTIVNIGTSYPICRFGSVAAPVSSCASITGGGGAWTQYLNWSTTIQGSPMVCATRQYSYYNGYNCGSSGVTTGSYPIYPGTHSWSNTALESLSGSSLSIPYAEGVCNSYGYTGCSPTLVYSAMVQIGCY